MKHKSQTGSAHVIIIIILVIAVIGLLGFVFWQNFINKPVATVAPNTDTSKQTTSPNLTSDIATEGSFGTGLSVKHPSSWKVTHETSGDFKDTTASQEDTTTITSPDTNTIVTMVANKNTQNSGGCTASYAQNLSISQLETDTIPQYTNAQFVSYVMHRKDADTYSYYAGLNDPSNTVNFATVCNNRGQYITVQSNKDVQFNISITKKNLVSPDSGYTFTSTAVDIINFLNSQDFKTAKVIVQSLYVK